jgi:phosphoribosylformylglycinamidine synthase subunit PurQ / glutaminase
MKFGVVVFPGSSGDHDAYHVIKKIIGQPVDFIWHRSTHVAGYDAVILPGGFSYGDHLRAGAIARFSPVMQAVGSFAAAGGLVLGIGNGFQILCETGLLPGALMRNRTLTFICQFVNLRVESTDTPFTHLYKAGQVLDIPIAHANGCYYCDAETLDELRREHRIIFRYCDEQGQVTVQANPSGSLDNIAGICNRERNILGLMSRPERASEEALGSSDGRTLFQSLAMALAELTRN